VNKYRRFAVIPIAMLVLAGCAGDDSGDGSPGGGEVGNFCDEASGEDLLVTICEEGTMQVSTDPNYEPQSFLNDQGELEGFDIDVAKELGARLGVEVEFATPTFDLVQAGGWNGQWDVSVGSITITVDRLDRLDFTDPYYYTPAQLAATEESGITDIDGFANESVCVGAATTYLDWINGDLELGDGSESAPVPEGITPVALETDALCVESIAAGREEFVGFLTASTVVQAAIDDDVAVVAVGDPVFYEPLAVAVDKSGPEHEQLLAALTQIVADMHEDGTLTAFSETWYDGLDLTVKSE
jgi:polar amino acid transport system substrate-binding protein